MVAVEQQGFEDAIAAGHRRVVEEDQRELRPVVADRAAKGLNCEDDGFYFLSGIDRRHINQLCPLFRATIGACEQFLTAINSFR